MRLVEGVARVGGERFPDVDAFVDRLATISADHGVTVQAFDARYVVGPEHVERAVELADRARERGEAIARERSVEILLYAAGRRQIDRAMEMGIGEGETPLVVVVDGQNGGGEGGGEGGDGDEGDDAGNGENGEDGGNGGNGGDAENGGNGEDAENGGNAGNGENGEDAGDGNERTAASTVREILEPAETLGDYDEELVCSFFDVSRRERAATDASLADLVLERVALLDVEK